MKFTLTIELGNDAMQTAEDVGFALQARAVELINLGAASMATLSPGGDHSRIIRDFNGNPVGKWEVTA
jgi:hypothetical protein